MLVSSNQDAALINKISFRYRKTKVILSTRPENSRLAGSSLSQRNK